MKSYLTRPEAASYINSQGLPYSAKTLQKLATTGGGPNYRIFGNRSVYTIQDIDDWISEKLVEPGSAA